MIILAINQVGFNATDVNIYVTKVQLDILLTRQIIQDSIKKRILLFQISKSD